MSFFEHLQKVTVTERGYLLQAPAIERALKGQLSLSTYIAFLVQAYHHVKHTSPLLMACGARLSEDQEWLREAIAEYIAEEKGHQEWILDDLRACGMDAEAVRRQTPELPTELMVSYVYDYINRRSPVGFFGMVNVLEGTSIALATQVAQVLQGSLSLPQQAFSYLTSHGSLDIEHVSFFKTLMDRLEDPKDQTHVIHVAKVVYRLYGDLFRILPLSGAH